MGKPLNISMLGSRGIPAVYGGIETALRELCPRLVARGHHVTVYTRARPSYPHTHYKGVRLKPLPAIHTKHFETATRLLCSLWHELYSDSDIVHFHALGPAIFSFLPSLLRKRSIVTIHGLDWQRAKWGWAARQTLKLGEFAAVRFPHATISVSQPISAYYQQKYGTAATYIPNGVNTPRLQPADQIGRFGLTAQKYLLFLSRLAPEKGAHYLIEAYKRLKTDFKLVVAGATAYADSYAAKLVQQCANHPNIILTGAVAGTMRAELFSNAYLYVLPSEIEGLPIALLEAMSHGLCVVASDIPANQSVIQQQYGRLFRSGDVAHLASTLQTLLDTPQTARTLGQQACEHVRQQYDWEQITDQVEAVYYQQQR